MDWDRAWDAVGSGYHSYYHAHTKCLDTSPPPLEKCQCEVIWDLVDVSWKGKEIEAGRGREIVLPISADTYFNPVHVSGVKGSASHAVRWRGVSASGLTAWAPRGLFLSRCAGHQWNRIGGVSHQTGRAHLFSTLPRRHSGSTSLQRWGRVSDITDVHHNECLRPSITWSSGLYLALSSLWHISFPLLHKAVPPRSTKTCQTADYGEGLELLA